MLCCVALISSVQLAAPARAGTIVGTVKFDGEPPATESVEIGVDAEVCGTEKSLQDLVVGTDSGLQWAVVRVTGRGGVNASAEPPSLAQIDCEFTPRVVIARPGEEMKILNQDGILHNVHTYSEENAAMNMAQPGFVPELPATFSEPELIEVTCDVHSWMKGWIVVTDSAHIAVTDDAGSFTLADVPAGTHEVTVWHESAGEQTQQVTVGDGEESQVAFVLSSE